MKSVKVNIHFGQELLEIAVPPGHVVASKRAPAAPAIADISAAVRRMLEEPIEFPPLRRALTPDDHITVVFSEELTHLPQLLTPILECLIDAGIKAEHVTLLGPPRLLSPTPNSWQAEIPARLQGFQVEIHEPGARQRVSYLASTKAGRRVYLNRTLVDADQIILLGRMSYDPSLGYSGGLSDVFPALSDEPTRTEFFQKALGASVANSNHEDEANEVGWLLGLPFVVQVISGAGGAYSHVLAGSAGKVFDEGRRLLEKHWRMTVARAADLVVAAISGEPVSQTFANVTRALACAARVVRPGGRIIVLCRASEAALGPSAAEMRKATSPAHGLRQARDRRLPDVAQAWQLAAAAQQGELFLMSSLPAETAQELFTTPVTQPSQVQQLVDKADSCLFLPDAHRLLAVLAT